MTAELANGPIFRPGPTLTSANRLQPRTRVAAARLRGGLPPARALTKPIRVEPLRESQPSSVAKARCGTPLRSAPATTCARYTPKETIDDVLADHGHTRIYYND